MNGEWYNQSPQEQRINELYTAYLDLIEQCTTDPQIMAKKIDKLAADSIHWEKKADDWRSKHIKAEHKIEALNEDIEALRRWSKERIKAVKEQSLLSIIKERLNKWFFGTKG